MSDYLKINPVLTCDGSHTLFSDKIGEHYHSHFGAIGESQHIFINAGLNYFRNNFNRDRIRILEAGYGTGLNALLAYIWCNDNNIFAEYISYEPYPVHEDSIAQLNYPEVLSVDRALFLAMHSGAFVDDNKLFKLSVRNAFLEHSEIEENSYDIVFYDAFSPEVQPELWTPEVFAKVYKAMRTGGVLTTYSCKGIVKRALKSAGFSIEKLPGPPGKREFLRAVK